MTGDLWVFGYGSLMWKPGFAADEVRHGTLAGYRRCFCITSVHHRGTLDRPGLVLGLDRGGMCQGMLFRVAAGRAAETLAALRAREQVNGVYRETHVPVSIGAGEVPIFAVAYVAERSHPSYAGTLSLSEQARIIRAARGLSGTNLDYLTSTVLQLARLGIRDRELERIGVLVGAVLARGEDADRRKRVKGVVAAHQDEPVQLKRMSRGARKRFLYRIKLGPAPKRG